MWLSWQRASLAFTKLWVPPLAPHKLDMVPYDIYTLNTRKVEARGSEVSKQTK